MNRSIQRIVEIVLVAELVCGQIPAQRSQTIAVGIIVPKVTCIADPAQSYALYLPSSFSATRKWPILYVFDPGARGAVAAEVIRGAAEKFGYIVAASNNSKNGMNGGSSVAANAMWRDTQQRLPIDERRRYFAGMSGGARVATGLALSCGGCAAGVVANAAGFPTNTGPRREMKFAYFAAVGDADFNFAEFVQLRRKLDDTGARYRIRIFEGSHGWAPTETWIEALNWMDLQAMIGETLPRDASRIQAALDEDVARAKAFEVHGDLLAAVGEYHAVIRDFSSAVDVSIAKNRLAELQKHRALKADEKRESSEIEQQAQIEQLPSAEMNKIPSGDLEALAFTDLRSTFADLKRQAAGSDRRALIMRRAIGGLGVRAYESGEGAIEQKNYSVALRFFELAAAGSQNPSWARYERARIYAINSDKKNMLAELRLCLAAEVHDASALDSSEFQPYRNQPEFQSLKGEWKKKAQP